MLQLFVHTAWALMFSPLWSRRPSKFHDAHWLKLIRRLRNQRVGVSLLICSQLLIERSSARRKKPRAFTSKPGDLRLTVELNSTRWPPILPMPMRAAVPANEVRVGSKLNARASGRWKSWRLFSCRPEIASGVPVTRLPTQYPLTLYRDLKRQAKSRPAAYV